MRNSNLIEFCVCLTVPSQIEQVRIPIQCVITLTRGVPYPIRQVIPLNSHNRTYPPYNSDLHPQCFSFLSTTQPSSQNTKLHHPSLSLHVMIMSWYRVQHTPSTAYTEYRIYRVQHTPSTACSGYSIFQVEHLPKSVFLPFIHMIASWPLNEASVSGVPSYMIDHHQPVLLESFKVKSPCRIPTVAR